MHLLPGRHASRPDVPGCARRIRGRRLPSAAMSTFAPAVVSGGDVPRRLGGANPPQLGRQTTTVRQADWLHVQGYANGDQLSIAYTHTSLSHGPCQQLLRPSIISGGSRAHSPRPKAPIFQPSAPSSSQQLVSDPAASKSCCTAVVRIQSEHLLTMFAAVSCLLSTASPQ
jgi:hypothetical protein